MRLWYLIAIQLAFAPAALADDLETRGTPKRAAPPKTGVVEPLIVRSAPEDDTPITLVSIDNRLGDVEIEGHDKNEIVIIGVKRAPDAEALERLKVALITHPDGSVEISTALKAAQEQARPIAAGTVRLDLVVRAPRDARVEAKLWNGRAVVSRVDNGADLSVNEGSIDIRQVSGKIRTKTARGEQQFTEVVDATIDALSVDGDLELDTITGEELEATVHEGRFVGRNIRVERAFVRTTKGDIVFEGGFSPGGVYRIASYRGDIEIKLKTNTALRVRAQSRTGIVSLPASYRAKADIDTGTVTGSYGGSKEGAQVSLRTKTGNITVVNF